MSETVRCDACGRDIGPKDPAFVEGAGVICAACRSLGAKPGTPPPDATDSLVTAVARESLIPPYAGLSAVAAILNVLGGVQIVGGVILGFSILLAGPPAGAIATLSAIGAVVFGVLLIGFGQAFAAMRDIARNSFQQAAANN